MNVTEPLKKGEGVAAFLVSVDGEKHVLYATYVQGTGTLEIATDERAFIRAAQAIAIQREARVAASRHGYDPVVA